MPLSTETSKIFQMPPPTPPTNSNEATINNNNTKIQNNLINNNNNNDSIEIDYEALPETATLGAQLAAGAFAGIMEHSIMFPVDAIKTRMQSFNTTTVYTGVLNAITRISSTEGSMALWRGINSMVLGAGPAHAVYFATYEYVKKNLIDDENQTNHHPIKTAFAGSCATVAADALMNPFDTLKQRMQLGSSNHSNSMFQLAKFMYKNEGFKSFYYSYPTTISMNIPFAALNFMIYESSTKLFNPQNNYDPIVHCFCGALSGATGAALTTPLDCIKTLLQIRGESKNIDVRNSNTLTKAARTIYQLNGMSGFWRGLKPRIIANVPSTAISWTAYEMAKHFLLD
ncbi:Mitochondrial RNA-splicing protein MRS4 [Wickerhamomyces ciferrii]|uniref:Mitochondrial RNA-splicing protein MRS4 n=1 Tax=Wickerhamomyces ciferrii (strain ATCC 14091 / BCRC 22168 / CBS 111 / JCM 3599 / NBRC 0793 / NRRL Y-1031 F-60-10) TaxID=1206466 RepID=K0KPK3_WICCF|nr:Mitochondrial RNA-splicing protein MRS4 [Wickerhamomyces ciferrii]CCH43088.1 Mitochondrial RNA-splicing protein MRS4 [Wickerhamomyces ciferrii]